MYLYCNSKRLCEEANDRTDSWEGKFETPRGIILSWRKANAIHNWFVENVQGGNDDCGIYEVDIERLAQLHDTCKEVLESTKLVDAEIENGKIYENGKWVPNMEPGQKLEDPTKAKELLPTQSGFFFGSTDYDKWYWRDLEYTMDKLEVIMKNLVPYGDYGWWVAHKDEPDWVVRFYYTASW